MDEAKKEVFLKDLKQFISKRKAVESTIESSINCSNMFDDEKLYEDEERLMSLALSTCNKSTTKQGDSLEDLMKALFGRVKIIDSVKVTNRDIAIGQIDLQLTPIDEQVYNIWGLIPDRPLGIIGECKNYGSNNKVGREEIEKTCWRACKSGFLSFFIGPKFTSGALNEINEFNLYKADICKKHCGIFVVPLNLEMIQIVVENKINFCYFIMWAIHRSKSHSITSHLRDS